MAENRYKVCTLGNFRKNEVLNQRLSKEQKKDIEVLGHILPFKANNYVIEELIDWNNIPDDPIFQLTFPQKGMLSPKHYREMEEAIDQKWKKPELNLLANQIRYQLNPHPAGQRNNIPVLNGEKLTGIQHKYRETILFFPSNSQTCHAYCTFCFRWPQFVGMDELKFSMRESDLLIEYLKEHPEVSDVLLTGGDPMVMSAQNLSSYLTPLIESGLPNLQTIRIGTKSLAYWPYRFLTDKDAEDVLKLFERVVQKGYHLALMAHFNHPCELETVAVQKAIKRIQNTGVIIRTQSPIMNHINKNAEDWVKMWNLQVKLGCIPYYMFIARDTGAQDYFAVSLEESWNIYREAYQRVSGIARTVRGPSMSANPGKIQILGIQDIHHQKAFVLRFIQGRNQNWVGRPFFAKYNPDAIWLDDLEPLPGNEAFFYQQEPLQDRIANGEQEWTYQLN